MKIEDVVREMRARLVWEDEPTLCQTSMWADALEQHVATLNPDWDKLKACQESLREHMALLREARQFDPPPEVIEAWPEDMPWAAKYTGQNVGWDYFTSDLHLNCRSVDPRYLHNRLRFYPSQEKTR